MIAIILTFNRRKESSLEEDTLPSLSYRYAALKVRGCDPGDRVLRGLTPGDIHRTGSCPLFELKLISLRMYLPRKEVIQPHLPVRLPCYDFTPLTLHTFGASPLSVGPATSGADDSGGVTGGVYKARERIHRGMLIRDY
jgi:hypothetical protein